MENFTFYIQLEFRRVWRFRHKNVNVLAQFYTADETGETAAACVCFLLQGRDGELVVTLLGWTRPAGRPADLLLCWRWKSELIVTFITDQTCLWHDFDFLNKLNLKILDLVIGDLVGCIDWLIQQYFGQNQGVYFFTLILAHAKIKLITVE